MNNTLSPAALKAMWISAKQREDNAKAERIEIENLILAQYPTDKTEGSITDANHGITITYKQNRTVDTEALQTSWESLSRNAQAAFRWKADIDLKQYRAIQDLDPQSFSQLAVFVTTKPGKPTVSIKE